MSRHFHSQVDKHSYNHYAGSPEEDEDDPRLERLAEAFDRSVFPLERGWADEFPGSLEVRQKRLAITSQHSTELVQQRLTDAQHHAVSMDSTHIVFLDFNSRPIVMYPRQAETARLHVVQKWQDYIGHMRLEDWQRFCHDLCLKGPYRNIGECKKVFKTIWVNIVDFLFTREELALFASEVDLRLYCKYARHKIFAKNLIDKRSPLMALLAYVQSERPGTQDDGVIQQIRWGTFHPWPLEHPHWIVESYEFSGKKHH